MSTIFISYRRDDTSGHALRVYRFLSEHIKSASVFLDTASIHRGQDWQHTIDKALQDASVVIALIGKRWLADSRLNDPADSVRRELLTALSNETPIIPVVVDGADLAGLARLPPELAGLANRQALWLDHREESAYVYDMDRLAAELLRLLNVQATLVVRRLKRFVQALFDVDIYVDGKKTGSLANGAEATITVSPGHHTLHLHKMVIFNFESRRLEFDVQHGDRKKFTFFIDQPGLRRAQYILIEGEV